MFDTDKAAPKQPKKDKEEPEQGELKPDGKKSIESCLECTLAEGCSKAYVLVFEVSEYPQTNKVMNALGYRKDFITFDSMV